ncbi:MAG: hypothetical protein COW24_05640 [Candidatus Kerfeldbacteria bacterium CG15_BIG_FIL_POST_REV_8_21_14_020_45_12]|uniref:Polymerase beta nucleotidyltransferase domain-containing protein n=1 Tax=Candidatus Kerfeldbacteria bacterium CG15_BIG_FIL_POST_REV_8_21_14_020_45_12 TaxID=2014247 RepID=A0A2M7H2G6_9BACT|nr:MAG: hypothetical protein COW24_05640 [Candidatus Kerfeldbacteria bacterium CG15_BIG_FIL_POST_REV_8_21_14_020_45_12]PJA93419.1 MAG: hypothetical protein CO132_02910 [Candidatus Kerfeldbacteria bacterium CG_4_9_14_3_um_filter_45_8]
MTRIHKPILDRISEALENDPRVVAAWLEGSIARGEDDDFSDIDLWISVKDRGFRPFVEEREEFAQKLGTSLSVLYPKTQDQDDEIDSFQIILEEQPLTLTIDVDVQKQSRAFKFTKGSAAEECQVLFDKAKIVTYKELDEADVEQYILELFNDVSLRFWHKFTKVIALQRRDDLAEAIAQYWERLGELVMLYRIQYTPEKVDWGFKDLAYDLPEDAVVVIERLLPNPHSRKFERQLSGLAKAFVKQSKKVATQLGVKLPKELMSHVMREI